MNIDKILEPINVNIQYGEENRSTSLQAYKCENELKRAVAKKEMAVRYRMYAIHQVPFFFEVKTSEPGAETITTERFTIKELIESKLTSANNKLCLSTYEVFQREGIENAIEYLHSQSPLTII